MIPYVKLGNQAFSKKNYQEALRHYHSALAAYKDSPLHKYIEKNYNLTLKYLNSKTYHECSVDVVIPVFNAQKDTELCLNSVYKSLENFDCRVIVVNDGSDNETTNFLRNFCANKQEIVLIEHSKNLGYTKAVNAGLKASLADYIITLNSDTIVSSQWIPRLLECIQSQPKFGIVGPLSNAASWQNFPSLLDKDGNFAVNQMPVGFNVDILQKFLDRYGMKKFPCVPFVNGFCFMIKREVLEKIGYMDEINFPTGYGEENDFCIRASKEGFELAIADNTYVFHAKSKSFGHSNRKHLSKQGSDKLKEKHGKLEVKNYINRIKHDSFLPLIREKLSYKLETILIEAENYACRENLKVGFILPVKGGGGGAHSVIQEASEMIKLGIDVKVYVTDSCCEDIFSNYSDIPEVQNMIVPYSKVQSKKHWFLSSSPRQLNLHYLVRQRTILVATVCTSVRLLKNIVNFNQSIQPAYYAQDYEPLFFEETTDIYKEARESYRLITNNVIFAKTDWIRTQISKNHNVYVDKVCPSIDESLYFPRPKEFSYRCKVLAMIRPSTPRRGAERTMKLLKILATKFNQKISIHIFGCDDESIEFLSLDRDFDFTNHGILTRSEVSEISHQCDIFIDLSDYQAFGRTGLEAMACGCVAILPKNGGADEYVIDGINSFLADYEEEPEHLLNILERLITEDHYRMEIKQKALKTASNYSIRNAAMSEIEVFSRHLKNFFVRYQLEKSVKIFYCQTKGGDPTGSCYVRFMSLIELTSDTSYNVELCSIEDPNDLSKHANVVIFQRFYMNTDNSTLKKIIEDHKQRGCIVVYDVDDQIFDPILLQSTGDINSRLAGKISEQSNFLATSADFIVTTTETMKMYINNHFSTNCLVIPNILSSEFWLDFYKKKNSPLCKFDHASEYLSTSFHNNKSFKIGYYGTSTHIKDLDCVGKSLNELSNQISTEINFFVIGAFQYLSADNIPFGQRINLPKDHSYPNFIDWLHQITSDWDLGLIPLIDDDFNQYKSNIKFLEYAILGLPIIVSEHEVYDNIARHNINCLVVGDNYLTWSQAITLMMDNSMLRANLAKQAFKDVTEFYLSRSNQVRTYLDAFEEFFNTYNCL